MATLQTAFLRFVRAKGLVRPGDRVLVAVSGGVDSVVLLHLLRASAASLRIEVVAAHFDHAMRPDSGADAEWVAGLCRAWAVPLVSERAARTLAGEADARAERYRFLHDAAQRCAARRIATAHHADDQVETVLFRLLRGTGLRGLAGIPVRRGRVIRPLLPFAKAELIAYARTHDLAWRTDPTNAGLHYTRNRLRNLVIPALESVRPDARGAVRRLAHHAARTEAAIQSALKRLEADVLVPSDGGETVLARPIFLEYHPALRALMLRRVLRPYGVVPTRAQTRALVDFCEGAASGSALTAGPGVCLERSFDQIRVRRIAPAGEAATACRIAGAAGRQTLELGGRRYDVAWQVGDGSGRGEAFDPALAEHGLELRGWRPGDRIRLAYGSKKLKKLFAERRVPASERARVPVLVDRAGRILWVVGVARAADAPSPASGPALNLTVTDAEFA